MSETAADVITASHHDQVLAIANRSLGYQSTETVTYTWMQSFVGDSSGEIYVVGGLGDFDTVEEAEEFRENNPAYFDRRDNTESTLLVRVKTTASQTYRKA